jgi:RNA polymerase sigma-70 factor (ECF subfamily)
VKGPFGNEVKQMDDVKIVQLYLDRDEQAIPTTARKYGNYCTSIAKNILGNQEDAEECVNDSYLNTWNAIPPHKPKMLSTFLGKIVRNLAFNRYKHNTADKRGGGELTAVLDELASCVSGKEDVEKNYEYKELVSAINEFLRTLPAKKRNIFVCRYWYTESIADISARFGMKTTAVAMMLSRLRNQLHNYLTERGYEP